MTSPEAIAADLQEAARAFFPDFTAIEATPRHPRLVKVETPTGLWRVCRWPDTTIAVDAAFSHEIMTQARAAGVPAAELATLPNSDGESVLRHEGRLYGAQQWLPGSPPPRAESAWPEPKDVIDLPVVLPAATFAAVIAAVAHLHAATGAIAARRGIPAAPLDMLTGAVRQAHGRHLGALRVRAPREPAIQRWLATSERLLARAEPIVRAATESGPLPTAIVHLGLWPAHVLLEGDRLTGLLGWERTAAGSPLLDLAQATLRLQGWSEEAVETAVGTYSVVQPLSPDERRLLPAVAALDAVAATGRLLEQTHGVPAAGRPPTAARAAIDMMLGSMAALDRGLTPRAEKKTRRTLRPPARTGGHRKGANPDGRRR